MVAADAPGITQRSSALDRGPDGVLGASELLGRRQVRIQANPTHAMRNVPERVAAEQEIRLTVAVETNSMDVRTLFVRRLHQRS